MSHLKVGDPAPAFEGTDQNGHHISLAALRGKKVVLYFYPKDNTPGCTAEACNLRDNFKIFSEKGYVIIGVSADNERSHKNFSEKFVLPFALLPDISKKIIDDYGVWGEKKLYGKSYEGINRMTFLIDEQGLISHIFSKVDTKNHAAQIFKATE
jgi:peroxiredoxin Q/BCP